MSYTIYDWAGNDLSKYHGTFKSFEDAWDYIQGAMTDKLGLTEDDYQEYYVEVSNSRLAKYLDPNDIRSGNQVIDK